MRSHENADPQHEEQSSEAHENGGHARDGELLKFRVLK